MIIFEVKYGCYQHSLSFPLSHGGKVYVEGRSGFAMRGRGGPHLSSESPFRVVV